MQVEKNTKIVKKKSYDHSQGKYNLLEELFKKMLVEGNLASIFLMDSEGLMISEYSTYDFNKKALSAVFSLVQNSIMRALDAIGANNLDYVKISVESGVFLIKDFEIKNYNKSFILVFFYHSDKNGTGYKPEVSRLKSITSQVTNFFKNMVKILIKKDEAYNSKNTRFLNSNTEINRIDLLRLVSDVIENIFA